MKPKEEELLEISGRIRALAQNGLTYSQNGYDTERYGELYDLADRMASIVTGHPEAQIGQCFVKLTGEYVTPKVDVRAVVFDGQGRLLLVRESDDGLWSLPGGWADVGFSPKEVAVKEVHEETGLLVEAVRLLALIDKRCHASHPPALHYVYKLFILCEITGGGFTDTFDILDKGFFGRDNLPPLSTNRVTPEQIELMFDYRDNPAKETYSD